MIGAYPRRWTSPAAEISRVSGRRESYCPGTHLRLNPRFSTLGSQDFRSMLSVGASEAGGINTEQHRFRRLEAFVASANSVSSPNSVDRFQLPRRSKDTKSFQRWEFREASATVKPVAASTVTGVRGHPVCRPTMAERFRWSVLQASPRFADHG